MPKRPGRKSASQTPAPKSERIYGSAKNPAKSASSEKSASKISLSASIIKALSKKLDEFKQTHSTKKVSLGDLKAVYRRGLGAYSKSHRPTITGGVPNTRNAWAMARVNKFLQKAAGEQVKAAYVQDDDLLKYEDGGEAGEDLNKIYKIQKMQQIQQTMADGGQPGEEIICANCAWEWNTADSQEQDKYKCHQCGFDNTIFYTVLKETMPLDQIAQKHGVDMEYLQKQFEEGAKHEMDEHTKGGTEISKEIGEIIALHHLEEMPDYYEKIAQIEQKDSGKEENKEESDEFVEFHEFTEPDVEYVRYSVWYPEIGENYDFYELADAVDHIEQKNVRGVIRDFDGRKVMDYGDIEKVLTGKAFVKDYERGGETETDPELKTQYQINDYLAEQKDEADAVLFSRRTKIGKFMICNAYIDMAKEKVKRAENALERQVWDQVINIWKQTKDEVDDVIYMYEEGGLAGGCGCTKYMSSKKMAKGGLAYGNSHDKGGMPMKVQSTGQNIEIEGGEGVINKRSMQSTKKVEFEGKQMTPCEVISKINQMGGGVKFDCSDVKEIIEKDGQF